MTAAVALLEWRLCGPGGRRPGLSSSRSTFLEAAILGAVALWLSTFLSTPLWPGSCRCWSVCWGTSRPPSTRLSWASRSLIWNKAAISVLYTLLPDLASFNFGDALVHHLVIPNGNLAQTAAYAVCYIWGALVSGLLLVRPP